MSLTHLRNQRWLHSFSNGGVGVISIDANCIRIDLLDSPRGAARVLGDANRAEYKQWVGVVFEQIQSEIDRSLYSFDLVVVADGKTIVTPAET